MESLQNSISEMMDMFQSRMSVFEEQLQKTPTGPSSTATLAAEFTAFRAFIIQAVNGLQQQVEILARSVDSLEMHGRRKILLLHGVPEDSKEDISALIVNVVRDKLLVKEFTTADIRRCHRMGRSTSIKPRTIMFKLSSVAVRDKVWFTKKNLKGTGITVSEYLTKGRHDVFLAAREKYGVTQCWTKAGSVYVLGPDGTRHRVTTFKDLDRIGLESRGLIEPASAESNPIESVLIKPSTPVKTKTRRAASQKK